MAPTLVAGRCCQTSRTGVNGLRTGAILSNYAVDGGCFDAVDDVVCCAGHGETVTSDLDVLLALKLFGQRLKLLGLIASKNSVPRSLVELLDFTNDQAL
jgi:hypothetical protein